MTNAQAKCSCPVMESTDGSGTVCPAHLHVSRGLKLHTFSGGGAGEGVGECVGAQTATSFLCDLAQVRLFRNYLPHLKKMNNT